MKKTKILMAIISAAAFNFANAATTSTPMQVTATVNAQCNVTANNLNFGTIQLNFSNPNMSTNISIECTNGTAFNLSFDGGLNPTQTGTYRLKHATLNEYLQYMIWLPSPYAGITPNQTAFSGTGSGITGTSSTIKTLTIQGGVNANASVSPGNYSDTVTINISY